MVEENWPIARDAILGGIPGAVRPLVASVARRSVRRQLEGHGIGRHSRDEIHEIGCKDVGAIADLLGDEGFDAVFVATGAGLFAAIPAVMFYNYLTNRVKTFAAGMDDFAMEFLNIAERNFT